MDKDKTKNQRRRSRLLSVFGGLVGLSASVTFVLWIWAQMVGARDTQLTYSFAFMLAITPLLASFVGFYAASQWGGFKSVAGRAIGALSLGLFLWSAGELVWSYYNIVLKIAAPYPSWADFGYAGGVLFWIVSAFILARLTGVPLLLRTKPFLRVIGSLVVIVSVGASYYLFVTVARQSMLLSDSHDLVKTILDVAYPLGDVLSVAIVGIVAATAGSYLGGLLKVPILLALAGMFASYLYDLTFSYTTTLGTYYNAQGSDILLWAATSLMSFSLVYYAYNAHKVRSSSLSRRAGVEG